MNIFNVFAFLVYSFSLVYTFGVNLGIVHYEKADPWNVDILNRVDRYYKRNRDPDLPNIDFLHTNVSDILSGNNTLCELTGIGIMGLIGPTFQPVAPILQSICANLEIPYIEYTWKSKSPPQKMSINFFPESELLAKGFAALVNSMNWKSFTVLYETADGLTRLREILKGSVPKDLPVIFKQINPGDDYRIVFKQITNYTENTIIIDCELERITTILLQAREVGMLEYHHKYFLANWDAHTLNFTVFNTTANITTISLLNTSTSVLHYAVKEWNDGMRYKIRPDTVKAEQAILHDATYFFVNAFYELRVTDRATGFIPEPLYCNNENFLQTGFRTYNYMLSKSIEIVGGLAVPILFGKEAALTAPIRFDEFGRRIDFNLYSVEIIDGKKEVIADWNPSLNDTVNIHRNLSEQVVAAVENLRKIKVIVASRLGAPYLFEKKPGENGNNSSYEGYAYDLIAQLAETMNFTFEFEIYKEYGKYDPDTKSWNGLIRALLDRKAHLAICDLTITESRRSVVDFSMPFMNLGISILHRKPNVAADANKFAFMDPFDLEVWLFTVTLYLVISSVLYVICRFAPGDWENPHPCDPDPEELENIWGLKNCFWLTLGSIMTQGCDILPKGISSRMGTSMWWFFSLIMTSSYTANLAAFLTKERMGTTITGAADLAKQTKIKYGTVLNGATMFFLKNSNDSTYSRLWANMDQAKPSVFEKSNDDGVQRVLSARRQLFAFFMESSSIEYEIEKNCNLKQVGGRLDNKGYGIAMPTNAPYRSAIDQQILLFQEQGKLAELKNRWWKERVKKTVTCDVICFQNNIFPLK
ncbi:hypothetical protein AMK59_8574 [Oryctes borbonicus]|uniref:Uncharacterized protein n=1 Tax=Oryctes borbonicus TaxID=1629725 RepID=A0A0T6AW37_9SCAR|nr:hypothetical protein AMK59_8574 [Oryctes borbonicus]